MTEAEIKSALIFALSEDWEEWRSYVLALIANSLTTRVRALLLHLLEEPEIATKLSAINEMQQAIAKRLINLFKEQDQGLEDAFVDWLFEKARTGQCTAELNIALCDVLSVLALQELSLKEI